MPGQFYDEQRQALDILRMSDHDHQALVSELDRSAIHARGQDKRRNRRLPYRSVRGLTLEVTHPGGSTVRFVVKPRNISRTGLSVLHGGFIHANTQCIVPLHSLTNRAVLVRGRIVTCRHIRGRIHELGIEFLQPIDVAQFVLAAPPTIGVAAADEVEAPSISDAQAGGLLSLPTLHGLVLVVDEWESDRRLLEYDLQKLGLRVVLAEDGTEALRLVQAARFDVVVAGDWLGDRAATDLVGAMRMLGKRTPVLGMFADASAAKVQAAMQAGIGAVVARPYPIERLAQILLQFLSFDAAWDEGANGRSPNGYNLSTKWVEAGMRPMILAFLQGLEIRLAALHAQLDDHQADPVAACRRLRSAAASYGFPRLSGAAETLLDLLEQDAPVDQMKATVHQLAGLAAASLTAAEQDIAA